MKPLTIELKPGERQGFTFVGWQMDGVAFYARDEDANPKIVTLRPAYPHNLDDGKPFAFPMLVPAEIFSTRLVPPSCVASKADINEFAGRLFREVVLFPQRKHEPAFRRSLKWCHAKAMKDQAAEIAAVKNATPLELFPFDAYHAAVATPKSPRQPEAIQAERQRLIREIEDKYRSRLTLTLDGLKRGKDDYAETLRNHVLISSWAKETGTDLGKMKLAAREFASQWYRAWGSSDHQPSPDDMPDDRAAVRFGIRFALGATLYLHGVSIRNLLTTAEIEDFGKLESVQQPPEPMPWHTEGFATIRRSNEKGETVETLPLSNEFRALCQLLAERPDQIAQFSEIEPQIGTRVHGLDIAAQVINPAQKGERRVRDLLRTETGRRLLEWGVLAEQEVGREKFLKLTAPKPV